LLAIVSVTRYLGYMQNEPIILPSAHRHGVPEEDMLHALRNTTGRPFVMDDGMVMWIGAARDGELIEVGVIEWYDVDAIAHAMRPARPRFL
jgi:hypothetical protein